MTAWDHRAAYAPLETFADSQLGERGANAPYNCVAATFIHMARVLGAPHIHPQQLVDAVYGVGFRRPEDYAPIVGGLRKLWSQLPKASIVHPDPPALLAAIDAAGLAGYPIGCSFYCDDRGVVVPTVTPHLHVSVVMAHDASGLSLLNVWKDTTQLLADADFLAATLFPAGWLCIFQQSIPTLSLTGETPCPSS
jgi:hypothetical protein